MTDLETRVRSELGSDWTSADSAWEGLMRLYKADREAFYLLACDGLGGDDAVIRPLADLAQWVRSAVRGTYRVVQQPGGETSLVPMVGNPVKVPNFLLESVNRFLLEIDGKNVADKPGKDYEGRPVSEAEVRFKLGEGDLGQIERLQSRREAKPVVFRVRDEDVRGLQTLPPYVTHGLVNCAKKTLLAPTAVYGGLNRGTNAPERLQHGWAICGKPKWAYNNSGCRIPAPEGMLYMVFADKNGDVFDWAWVREDDAYPGHPRNLEIRFDGPIDEKRELVLELPDELEPGPFNAAKPVPSRTGDCVFCYMTDTPSFAERINEDLTVYYAFNEQDKITGLKIKNVERILDEEQAVHLKDAPGLNVLIRPILRKALKLHADVTVKLYELLIAAYVHVPITLPSQSPNDSGLATATR